MRSDKWTCMQVSEHAESAFLMLMQERRLVEAIKLAGEMWCRGQNCNSSLTLFYRFMKYLTSFMLNYPQRLISSIYLWEKRAAVSLRSAHPSLRYTAFVSTSLSGCFHRSHSHYFILLCSSVVSTTTAGVKLLWLEFLEEIEKDWRSRPCRKHHLLSLFFFSVPLVEKKLCFCQILTLEKNNLSERERENKSWADDELEAENRSYKCNISVGLEVVSDRLVWFSGATHWSLLY